MRNRAGRRQRENLDPRLEARVWLARSEYRNSNRMTNAVRRLEQITVPPNSVSDVRRLMDDLSQCANITRVSGVYAQGLEGVHRLKRSAWQGDPDRTGLSNSRVPSYAGQMGLR